MPISAWRHGERSPVGTKANGAQSRRRAACIAYGHGAAATRRACRSVTALCEPPLPTCRQRQTFPARAEGSELSTDAVIRRRFQTSFAVESGTEGSRQRSHTKASHRRFGVRTDAKEASMKRLHGSADVFGGEPLTPLGPAQLSSRRTPWPRSWLRGPRGGKHAILQQNGLVQFLPGNYTIMVHVCQSTPA